MRGRKPKPTARRKLEGNPRQHRLNADEPQPDPVTDTFDLPPRELANHPLAAEEWRRLAPLLRKSRIVTEADRSALLALCLQWARFLEAYEKTAALVVSTKTGHPMPNPYIPIANRALAACIKLWPELGLTPSSRSRVVAAPAPTDQDPFAEFDAPPFREDDRTH